MEKSVNEKIFPKLYKKTSTGAIQYWEISSSEGSMGGKPAAMVWTEYGQLNTDSPQTTQDIISKGKNTGKKNATTPYEQAEAEALAKWQKQLKKGYVESIEAAQNDELDELIEGGIVPMLAHKFAEQGHKIKYPAYIQPKLDGIRCVAIVKDGLATLWSRTRKPITSMPHIIAEIEAIFPDQDIMLDGELYNHAMKSDFEKIVSLVRQEEPGEGHEIVQYHIYDVISEGSFEERWIKLNEFFTLWTIGDEDDSIGITYLKQVTTVKIQEEAQVINLFDAFREQGYEGAMLRNASSLYVNKRSYDLQKVKEFDDNEFEIIGIEEGRGRLAGHVGSFVCKMDNGKEFLAKAKGATENLKKYFEDHSLWKGKRLTVQYQGLTGYGIPRFPVGVAIRDYE